MSYLDPYSRALVLGRLWADCHDGEAGDDERRAIGEELHGLWLHGPGPGSARMPDLLDLFASGVRGRSEELWRDRRAA